MRISNTGYNSYNNYNLLKKMLQNKNATANSDATKSVPISSCATNSGGREMPIVPKIAYPEYNPFTPIQELSSDDKADIDKKSDELAQKFIENGFNSSQAADTGVKSGQIKNLHIITEAVKKARIPIQAKEIGQILKDNGITLEQNEKLNIQVDKKGVITVTGDNSEKAKKIEDILNSQEKLGWKLNRLTNLYSSRYKVEDGKEYDPDIFHEMDIEDTLRYLSNGDVSLSDLSVKNGKIMGLPKELDGLINGTNPDMTEDEKISYGQFKIVTLKLLQRGIDNIPDLTTNATYENGVLKFN